MRAPEPSDHKAYRELDDVQSGAPFNAFNRSNALRHPMLTTTWERILAVVALAFVAITLISLVLRSVR